MTARHFEMNPDQMLRSMDLVAARARDLVDTLNASKKKSPDPIMRDRALSLLGECAELGCPPPVELLHAFRLAFLLNERVTLGARKHNAIGDGEGLQADYIQRLQAQRYGISPKSVPAFRAAAAKEAEAFDPLLDGAKRFQKPVNEVASAAEQVSGTDDSRKSVKEWRLNPAYVDEILDIRHRHGVGE